MPAGRVARSAQYATRTSGLQADPRVRADVKPGKHASPAAAGFDVHFTKPVHVALVQQLLAELAR